MPPEINVQEVLDSSAKAPVAPAPQASPASAPAAMPDKAAVDEVKKAQDQEDPEFTAKFAALTRKQKELFVREQEIKKKWDLVQKYEQMEKLKAEDPYKFAKEQGLDFDRLVQGAVKDGEPPTIEDKIAAMEKKIAAYEKEKEESLKQSQERESQNKVDAFKKSIDDVISTNADKYELISLEGANETVFEVIQQHFLRTESETGTGELLSVDAAADMVEKFLNDKALKLLQAKKLGFTMNKPEPKAPEAPAPKLMEDVLPDDEKSLTLSGAMTPATSAPTSRYETPEQAKARIAQEFNAKFKAKRV